MPVWGGHQCRRQGGSCDYTGKRGVYTPKYTLNTGLTYKRELANATFTTGLDRNT